MNNDRIISDITELIDKATKFEKIMEELGTTSNTTLDKVKSLKDDRVEDLGFDPIKLKDRIENMKVYYEDLVNDVTNAASNALSYMSDAKCEIQDLEDKYVEEDYTNEVNEMLESL